MKRKWSVIVLHDQCLCVFSFFLFCFLFFNSIHLSKSQLFLNRIKSVWKSLLSIVWNPYHFGLFIGDYIQPVLSKTCEESNRPANITKALYLCFLFFFFFFFGTKAKELDLFETMLEQKGLYILGSAQFYRLWALEENLLWHWVSQRPLEYVTFHIYF